MMPMSSPMMNRMLGFLAVVWAGLVAGSGKPERHEQNPRGAG